MAAPAGRLVSLDAFRGLTIASMILVNNPGTWSAIYWPLEHAPWHGWTPTDLIFPFFLFMVGMSIHFSSKTVAREASPKAYEPEVLNEDEESVEFVEEGEGVPELGINLSGFESEDKLSA